MTKEIVISNEIGLTISKVSLLAALSNVQSVVQNRNPFAILANVKLDADVDKITITATDMDITISETIAADVTTSGTLTVGAHALHNIIKKMPEGCTVDIRGDSATSGKVQIKSKGCRFVLPTIASDDFPVMTRGDLTCEIDIATTEFLALLTKTSFAFSKDESRHYLQGVSLKRDNNKIIARATDTHKLAKIATVTPIDVNIFPTFEEFPDIIIPAKTVGILTKILNKPLGDVKISLSSNKLCVGFGNVVIISKLVDGEFPDTDKFSPSELVNKLEVDREPILKAIDRVSLATNVMTNAISIVIKGDMMVVSAQSPENGSAEEDIPIDCNIDFVKRNYNSKYLLELLSSLNSDSVIFYFAEKPGIPNVILNPAADNEYYIIMPMSD